jgi:hypothetical protein
MAVYLKYITVKNQCVKHLLWKNKLNDVKHQDVQELKSDIKQWCKFVHCVGFFYYVL